MDEKKKAVIKRIEDAGDSWFAMVGNVTADETVEAVVGMNNCSLDVYIKTFVRTILDQVLKLDPKTDKKETVMMLIKAVTAEAVNVLSQSDEDVKETIKTLLDRYDKRD